MDPATCPGCQEYRNWSRRDVLRTAAISAAALAAAPSWLPRVAFAQDYRSGPRDVIVQVFLRGGADGLTIVPPWSDPLYYSNRPTLAVPRPDNLSVPLSHRTIALNNSGPVQFGLNPALAPLVPAYADGNLLVLHAVGLNDSTRSHFDAMRYMEVGRNDDPLLRTGWLGRHIGSVSPVSETAPLRALALSSGVQQTLAGGPRTLAFADPARATIGGSSATQLTRRARLYDMYSRRNDLLKPIAVDTLATIDQLTAIDFPAYQPAPGVTYDTTNSFAYGLRASAALIKAQIGVEAVAIDFGGWDTHTQQGSLPGGEMYGNLASLGAALAAFYQDTLNQNVLVVVLSEFGRRVKENGDKGTDHGHGNAMLLIGKGIAGGRVLTTWPGLAPEQLDQGDLEITVDYRDILAELVARRLGNSNLSTVFPAFTPTFRNVTRP